MDIKLETLRYHLVIFWGDIFTIDILLQKWVICNTKPLHVLSCLFEMSMEKIITSVPDSCALIMWLIFALIEPQIVKIVFQEIFKYICCH